MHSFQTCCTATPGHRTAQPCLHGAPSCLQVNISVTKDGVKFSTSGDIGSANITVRQNNAVDKPEEATDIDLNVGCFC